VNKATIVSPRLMGRETFYEHFVKAMVARDDALRAARMVIDGSGSREFRRDMGLAFRRRVHEGAIESVRFKDSARDDLLQLDDMCVGAIARSYRADRPDADRWRKMLAPRIDHVWDFR
jgi:hypothetical protein